MNRKRAFLKVLVVCALAALTLAGLVYFVNGQTVDEIKYNFSLTVIIALVVIINLVGFLCFIVLYAAYQWIRADLKTGSHEREDRDLAD